MSQLLSAVYESGVFRPTTRPQLDEGVQVEILVRPRQMLSPKSVAEALATAAAMPVARFGDPLTSRNDDRVIYDEDQSS